MQNPLQALTSVPEETTSETRPQEISSNKEMLGGELSQLREAGLWRECVVSEGAAGPHITIDGRRYLNLCSNNYLDLAGHPDVARAAAEAAEKWGTGAGSARLVTGTPRITVEFEQELAEFKQAEAALLFSSGYMANLGLVTALAGPGDWLICDRLNHASLIDAARLSRAEIHTYPHGDAEAAGRALSAAPSLSRKVILTDGVFSMDGDVAPLAELNELALRHGAWLSVDDAHGTGVLGSEGRGSVNAAGITGGHIVQVITLSKALGSQGGAVVGSREVIELLVNRARTFVYETGIAPPSVAAAKAALEIVRNDVARRESLRRNVELLRGRFIESGFVLPDCRTPIFPLLVGTNERALTTAASLRDAGYWITAIRPPTVPEGTARLRITVMSSHTEEEINSFSQTVAITLNSFIPEAWGNR